MIWISSWPNLPTDKRIYEELGMSASESAERDVVARLESAGAEYEM